MNRTIRIAPLLFGTLALSAPLLAHPPGMPGAGMHGDLFATMDSNHDGRISAQEHAAAAQLMFARADADHDGYLTRDELQAMHAHGAGGDAMKQDMQATGHDTGVAPATKPAMAGMHDDRTPASGGLQHDMGMRDHFQAMDTDGDGRLSASEHAAGAAKMFAAMDADHDGSLSQAEFDAGHAGMMRGGMAEDGKRRDGQPAAGHR